MISEKRGSNLLAMEIARLRCELKKEVTEGLLTRCDKLALVMQFEIYFGEHEAIHENSSVR